MVRGAAGFLRAGERALASRAGRRVFCAAVALLFVGFGAVVVIRAEIPKHRYVDELSYGSPLEIGAGTDRQAKYHSSEFNGFRKQAWGVLLAGMDPYDPEQFHVRAYPPFFNIVFLPFALLWRLTGVGSALFYAVSFGLTVLSAWWLSRWGAAEGRDGFGFFALVFLLVVPLALNVMARCETDMLVLGAVSAALMLHVRGRRDFAAGFLLGCATAFKVLPGLFGVYFLCRRKWTAAAGMITGGLFCTVLLPVFVFGPSRAVALHVSWYKGVVAPYGSEGAGAVIGDGARPSNQSLAATLQRLCLPVPVKVRSGERRPMNLVSLSPGAVGGVTKGIQAVVGLGLVFLWVFCARRGARPRVVATLFGLTAPGILILSEMSLTTHHMLLLVPLSVFVLRVMDDGDKGAGRWAWLVPLYLLAMAGTAIGPVKAYSPLLFLTFATLAGGAVMLRAAGAGGCSCASCVPGTGGG